MAAGRQAIDLDPRYAAAHNGLGCVLADKGDRDGATAEFRRAIECDPKYGPGHDNLGNALSHKGDLNGAIAEYRKATDLSPTYAPAHYNLGIALEGRGNLDGAIAEYKKAIEFDPTFAAFHYNLGVVLAKRGQYDDAIAEFDRAIHLDPKLAYAHGGLGEALLRQGRFAEARTATRTSLALLPERDPLRQVASGQLLRCEQGLALEGKLAAILEGKEKPADDAERLALAWLCQQRFKMLYVASTRFSAEAFANDSKLAEDLNALHRYNAACAAALAGCGQGKDAGALADKERTRLRQQALDWLRADLEAWSHLLEKEPDKARPVIVRQMQHWLEDPDFAGVRGDAVLVKLPEAERRSWQQLWAEVAETLGRAAATAVPETKSAPK